MLPFKNKKYLVLAIGGGGDVVSAAVIAKSMEKIGFKTVIGSIAWERFVVDPMPGPIPLDNIIGCRDISRYACIVNRDSYALRGGRKIVFQAVNVARALNTEIVVIDIYEGVKGYRRGVESVINYYGLDGVIGVDVGGDVLAYGFEENLWSPLADALGLAMLNKISDSYLIVHSLGSDGELPIDYLHKRLSIIAKNNGLLGITGFSSETRGILENILYYAESEASKISLYALNGFMGKLGIRRGTRTVEVTPYSLVSFILDPRIVFGESLVARVVDKASSFMEARLMLNSIGIYTEYDLEEDIYSSNIPVEELTSEAILKIRLEGIKRLRELVSINDHT